MKRAPRSPQHHILYAKYQSRDSETSKVLGECGSTPILLFLFIEKHPNSKGVKNETLREQRMHVKNNNIEDRKGKLENLVV